MLCPTVLHLALVLASENTILLQCCRAKIASHLILTPHYIVTIGYLCPEHSVTNGSSNQTKYSTTFGARPSIVPQLYQYMAKPMVEQKGCPVS